MRYSELTIVIVTIDDLFNVQRKTLFVYLAKSYEVLKQCS